MTILDGSAGYLFWQYVINRLIDVMYLRWLSSFITSAGRRGRHTLPLRSAAAGERCGATERERTSYFVHKDLGSRSTLVDANGRHTHGPRRVADGHQHVLFVRLASTQITRSEKERTCQVTRCCRNAARTVPTFTYSRCSMKPTISRTFSKIPDGSACAQETRGTR